MTVDPAKQQLDEVPEDHAPESQPVRDPEARSAEGESLEQRLAAAEAEGLSEEDTTARMMEVAARG
jgi:hypothetical protein